MSTTDPPPVDPMAVDVNYIEVPDWPVGTRLSCQQCGSYQVIYPHRTMDPRWAIGWCIGCKKRRIVDVHLPPTKLVDNPVDLTDQ